MEVVAVGTEEDRAAKGAGDRHPQGAGDEILGRVQVAHLQVDVTDDGAVGHARKGSGTGRRGEIVKVDPQRRHADPAVGLARPVLARTVVVDLDPVPLGVGQVQRLADQVVGRAVKPNPRRGRVDEPVGQVLAAGQQEGGVKQPRLPPVGDRGVGIVAQFNQHPPPRAELVDVSVRADRGQPDRIAVKAAHPIQVAHRQRHRPDPQRCPGRGDPGGGRRNVILHRALSLPLRA